jgi:hypothetical protein
MKKAPAGAFFFSCTGKGGALAAFGFLYNVIRYRELRPNDSDF